ncbi:MAG: tetratricopeptide repeat protein [Candidatus Latescibacteria bacterium]|nr:tetratricopeptide repeat protein [Candidatus Latescibacterota bacterium]
MKAITPNMRLRLALAGILVLAAGLRLWGTVFGAPAWHPDEFNFVYWPLLFFMSGKLNPGFFYYPHLQYYLLGLVYGAHFLWQQVFGAGWSLEQGAAYAYFWDRDTPLLLARLTSVAMALVTVVWAWVLARRVYGEWAGLAAALLLAGGVLHVRQSPLAAVDVPMACWYMGAVWAAVRLLQQYRLTDYILAGVLVGLAGATKYQGGLAGAAVLSAHLLARRSLVDRRLWSAGLAAVGTFLVSTPYVVLDFSGFRNGFSAVVEHTLQGQDNLGPGWWYHLHTSLRYNLGWPGLALLLLALAHACWRPRREVWVVLSGFLAYYLVIGAGSLVFVRYAIPLAALQAVLVAGLLAELKEARWRWLALGLVALGPFYNSVRVAQLLAATDTRQQAREWIEAQVPADATLCNFGGWAGDPPLNSVEDLWRRTAYLVRQTGTFPEGLLPFLDLTAPKTPFYHLAIQPGSRRYEQGSREAVEAFECGYVLLNRHPLSSSPLDKDFLAALPALGKQVARFTPVGMREGDKPAFDPIDAYFVPLGGFGALRQPGPEIEVWRVKDAPPAGTPAQSGRQLFATAYMRGAQSMLEEGQPAAFLNLATHACALDPGQANSRFHTLAGTACRQLGRSQEALVHWQRALELDPHNTEAAYLTGMAHYGSGEYEQALGFLEQVVAFDAKDVSAYNSLASTYQTLGRYEEAVSNWKRAITLQPDYGKAYYNLGVAYLRYLGRPDLAKECFGRLLALEPDHPQAAALRRLLQEP